MTFHVTTLDANSKITKGDGSVDFALSGTLQADGRARRRRRHRLRRHRRQRHHRRHLPERDAVADDRRSCPAAALTALNMTRCCSRTIRRSSPWCRSRRAARSTPAAASGRSRTPSITLDADVTPRLDLGAGEVAVFNVNRRRQLHHQLHRRRPDRARSPSRAEFPAKPAASAASLPVKQELDMRTLALFFVAGLTAAASPRPRPRAPSSTSQQDFKVGAHPTIIVDSSAGGVEFTAGAGRHRPRRRRAPGRQRRRGAQARGAAQAGGQHRAHPLRAQGRRLARQRVGALCRSPRPPTPSSRSRPAAAASARAASPAASRSRPAAAASTSTAPRARSTCARAAAASRRATSTAPSTYRPAAARCASKARSAGKNRVETGGGSIHVDHPGQRQARRRRVDGRRQRQNEFGLASDGERHSGRFHGNIGDGSAG